MRRKAPARSTMTGAIPRGPKSGGSCPCSARVIAATRVNATKYMAMPARIPCPGAGDHREGKSRNAAQPTRIRRTKTGIQDGRMASPSSVPGDEGAVDRGARDRGGGPHAHTARETSHAAAPLLHRSDELVGQRHEAPGELEPVELLGRHARDPALGLDVDRTAPQPEPVVPSVHPLEIGLRRRGLPVPEHLERLDARLSSGLEQDEIPGTVRVVVE